MSEWGAKRNNERNNDDDGGLLGVHCVASSLGADRVLACVLLCFLFFTLLAIGEGAVMRAPALVWIACHACIAMSAQSLRACVRQFCACTPWAAHAVALCLVHVAC